MEDQDFEVPPPHRPTLVGVVYNLKKGIVQADVPDSEAEYDNIDTVHAIQKALEESGFRTELFEAGPGLTDKLLQTRVDIVFNIAEGFVGRGREAQIPALLNILNIPFTGSDETTLCLALDKAITKRILSSYHILTPKYTIYSKNRRISPGSLKFPVIIKPNAEGSSKGISDVSIAENQDQLIQQITRSIDMYQEDMMAEEYIEGREFTVGILGNGDETHVFPPMEIIYQRETQGSFHVYSYTVKQNYKEYVSYSCPADLAPAVEKEMIRKAKRVYEILSCRDFARIDFRLSPDGKIYFIEVNPLPGLAPNYSDYPMLAEFCGVDYRTLIVRILKAAADRCGITLHSSR